MRSNKISLIGFGEFAACVKLSTRDWLIVLKHGIGEGDTVVTGQLRN